MSARGAEVRERSLERLRAGIFDVLVIGAGIVGARVAFEAANAGLEVALVDAGDFGGATSSASGKLVHGGLRYLQTGNVRLVRAARRERRILAGHVAPHLVHRLPFLLATAGYGGYPATAAGLFAYWALDGFSKPAPRLVSAKVARSLVPPLRVTGACALLEEALTDDGRLTLATVKVAARAGAVVANYLRVVELEHPSGRISGAILEGRGGEGSFAVRCRAVVNATGPWIDHVRLLEDSKRSPLARLSKGVHLVLSLEGPDLWAQAHYAADEEWALTVEDIVRRRTTLSIRGLATDDVRARLASVFDIVRS